MYHEAQRETFLKTHELDFAYAVSGLRVTRERARQLVLRMFFRLIPFAFTIRTGAAAHTEGK
jgi:Tfp pilus assembly pilus retraction ATPase PilT